MLKSIIAILGLMSVISLYQFNSSFEHKTIDSSVTSNVSINEQIDSIKPLIDNLNELYSQKKLASPEKAKILASKIQSLKKELVQFKFQELPATKAELKMDPIALCPEINTVELINVAGFASTDQLVKCGDPDTLAYVVFIEEPGDILGAQMTLTFDQGMQYAGFELTHYTGTTISNLDPDPIKPKFLLEGITDAVFIAYIGVESTCDADINGLEYRVDLEYNFTFQDTFGNIQNCRQKAFPTRVYNSTIKTPVLNYRSTPVTTINSLSEEYCTTIQISQDGIQAYLKDFEFAVCGLDLANELTLTSTSVNGIPITSSYTASDSTLSLSIDDSYFPSNTTPNPSDNYFNENEKLNIQFCYEVTDCPTENTQFITYKASWGCNDDVCMSIAKASEIRIRPTQRPDPYTTVEKLSNPGVCGDPGIIELTMYAAETGTNVAIQDSAAGLFTDITLGFETCDQSSLGVTQVNIGETSLPSSTFTWTNGDLIIDFQALTTDPDGVGGITDADGDGFFDDLPGGETLMLQVELEFLCELPPDPSSIACSSVDCSFAKFFVQAKRDCGQSFKIFPDIEEFDIVNGATYVELKGQTLINNNFYGYDFGVVGNLTNCEARPAQTRTIEFCYIYERENVEPCPEASTTNELQVVFSGSPIAVNDIQFVPGSGELAVNGTTTASGATGTFTDISQDKRVLNLPIGSLNTGDEICYKYQLVADTAICVPPQYMVGIHQVIETCDTGDCTCVTVKGCDATEFRIDPTDCDCTCDIASGGTVTRWNLGYTDATMSEKIDREDVPVEDLSRFLPCDTMYYEGWMKLLTPETVGELYQWYFVANMTNLGYNGWRSDETELMIDASGTELLAIEFSKEGSTVRQNVDMTMFSDCVDKPETGSPGFWAYAAETPWGDEIAHAPMCNSSYEHHDGNLFGIYFRNFNMLEDCRETETTSWEESDCLQQFIDHFNVEVGDSIHMKWLLPLTKNVKAHARKEVDPTFTYAPPQIINVATGHYLDEFDSDCLLGLSNCRENTPFSTFCPNGINAITDMEVDDCGGKVEHDFNVIQSTPVNWYTQEYRPYFNMQDITVPIYTPMMYCGNARLVTTGGVEYPLEVTEFTNHTCATVGTQEYCSVSSGDVGMLTFNLEENGYPGLAVGLGGITDGFTIEYDLCRVCPVELSDLSDYEIAYDYKICDPLDGNCFRCWVREDGTYAQITEICSRDGSTPVGHNESYYDYFDGDQLFLHSETSEDFNVTDVSNGFPALTQEADRLLMASGSPGSSEEINTIEICADGEDLDLEVHRSVLGSVTITNSLALVNVYDENMNIIPSNFVSSSGGNSTYSFPMDTLAPGDCVDIKLGTTLLYCPQEPEIAELCLTVTSGCLDRDILAAVVGNASNCNTSTSCYRYVTEESDIQANFLSFGDTEYPLCGEIPIAALVKNVQTATLTDLALQFNLPLNGAAIVPGSFMASYPNNGDLSGATPFYSISDPIVNGNILSYPEDSVFSNHIHSQGFPGVLSSLDSNFVVVKFLIKTDCDEFVSGSIATFEGTAIDPCSPDILSTGEVTSDEFIIQGANPNDFAKILVTAKPSEAFCGQSDPEFTVTGLNISEKPSGDSLQMCITLPEELTYVPGSMLYAIPAGQSVGAETVTMIGTQTQVCFDGYNNMPVGGQFTLKFRANFQEDTPCGDYKVGVDIKELRPSEICDDGGVCDVFVQSSVNPDFTVTLKGPLETAELKLTRSCEGGDDPVTMCYEALLNNPGSDYSGTVTVNLHEDLNSNGVYDFFDPIMGTMEFPGTFVTANESVTLTGCFEVPLAKSCPVILNVVYETECNCDNSVSPFTEIVPGFTVDLPSTIYLCPGEKLALDTCSNYTITFDPPANVTTESTNDSLYICLVDPSISTEMTLTGIGGDCSTYEPFKIEGIEALDLVLAETETCQNVPLTLELDLPSKYQDFVDVTWSPVSNLDNPNILDPIFSSNIPGDYNYTVTMQISETCSIVTEVTVTVLPNGILEIGGDDLFCFDYSPADLKATAGYDYYEWYSLIGGFEIIQASTMTNTWTGPLTPGDYFVKGFKSTDPCPSVSGLHRVDSKECFDLELQKNVINIPSPFTLGSTVTYEIIVCNVNDPDIGMVFDATGIQIVDQLPGELSYVTHTHTNGSYSPGSNEWDIDIIENGTCDTLLIDVTVDEYGCIINDAQISMMDKEDIDSTPNNDDGDQSEDDEDNGKVEVDTFDLSLIKKLSPLQTSPVTIGSLVTYDIEVCNQGEVDAYNIDIVDYLPTNMTVDLALNIGWSLGAGNEYFYRIPGPITPGNCTMVSFITEVDMIPASGAITNYSEISNAEDANRNNPPDVDSDPDDDPDNDGPVTDNEVENLKDDEDDHDPASISVVEVECTIANNIPVCPETPINFIEIGMGNVEWAWSGPDGFSASTKTITLDPGVPGIYTVTVTNGFGLSKVCEVNAIKHPEMQLLGTIENVSCKDGSDGAVDLTVLGGTPPFSYDWDDDGPDSPDNDNQDVSGLSVGTYNVIVTDANGCVLTDSFTLTEPTELACKLSSTDISCYEGDDGTIIVASTGGTPSYTYSLNGGPYQSGNTFLGLGAGMYEVTTRDDNGCLVVCSITLSEPSLLSCTTNVTDDSSCIADNGRIEVIGTGGAGGYQYSIDDGTTYQTSAIFAGLGEGNYTITIKDNNNCVTNCTTSITSPTLPVCEVSVVTDVSCNSFMDGSLTAEASFGSGVFEFSLDSLAWQSSGQFTNLAAGSYKVIVRNIDTPTCTSACSANIDEPTTVTCQLIGTDVSCNNGNDGIVEVASIGGDGNLDYSIDNGVSWQISNTFSNLTAGDYEVTVRTNGDDMCISTCEITISEPTLLSCSSEVVLVLCNGDNSGGVNMSAIGGTAPYEYSLNGGAWQPGNVFMGLEAGNYNMSVRDGQGCLTSCPFVIGEPTALVCSTTTSDATDCDTDDGTITVSATAGTPGYMYSIDGTNFQVSNSFIGLMPGSYIVSTKDANGCVTTCQAIINGPNIPMCQIASVTHVECYGESTGQIVVTGNGGNPPYEFSLDNSTWQANGVFNSLAAGMHNIYIRNNSSITCASMCTIEITEPEELQCLLTPNDPLCKGGTDGNITVVATEGTPGYEYSLDGGPWQPSHVFNNLAAGDYTVTIRDDNRCTKTCTVTLGEPTLLVCSTVTVDLLCFNDNTGSISVNGSGGTPGYDYNLDGGFWQDDNVFENVSAGTYTVYIRDKNDCVSTCSATVNEPQILTCELVELLPESCSFDDGSIEVVAAGGTAPVTYSINGGTTTQNNGLFEGLTLGVYTITIVDANGCVVTCEHEILPDCFDLALTKQLVTPGPYVYGQVVEFEINVINQGNIDAADIEVTDHVPCGFEYVLASLINQANDWTPFMTTFPMTVISSLPAQSTTTVQIELMVKECTTVDGHINVAEISEAFDDDGNPGDDIDSTPDYDPDNDLGGEPNGPTDDQEDGDGTDDEDDHDPAFVPIYDVALTKELLTPPAYSYGQLLEFSIEVCNESSPIVTDVTITDHIPVGYSYDGGDNPGWSGVGAPTPADVTYTIAGPIVGGDCVSVPIFLTVEMAGGVEDWKNVAEVSEIKDEDGDPVDDVDSDEDNDDGDQSEDDEDSADLEVVDAALVKTTNATGPFSYGDQVTFDIEVFNQGNVDLYNVKVNDFIPCGYAYLGVNSPLWIFDSGTNVANTTLPGPINPGMSEIVTITLEVQPCSAAPQSAWTNVSEIESFEDEDGEDISDDDIDSDADDDPTNDTTEDNVNDNTSGDEDDNDPETIKVFDLAQIKQVVTAAPYAYGDLIEYKITLINQGNVAATDVVLTDHLPAGLSFDSNDNAGWDDTNAPSYDFTVAGPVLSGDTVCVPIFVTVEMTTGGSDNYTNIGEISSAENEDGEPTEDADSDPDDDPNNDGDPTDDSTDDPDDSDDHDPESIEVVDLALVKTTTATGPFKYGDQVTFDIEIFNQGNIDAYDVVMNDFIPCGFKWLVSNEPVWSAVGDIATTQITGPIVAGTSEIVSITLEVQACASDAPGSVQGAWENISEIATFKNEDGEDITDDDIDSDADSDPNNDDTEDNVNDNTDGDEDDNDPEEIDVFDLAQIKKIVTPGPYMYGDTIEYSICVVNQGNVTATEIQIMDYLPEGLGFEAVLNTDWEETSTDIIEYTIDGPLLRDDTICIPIFLTIDMTMGGGNDHTNISEISSAKDEEGEQGEDADSTADNDPDNDGDSDNDSYHDEEDDHDPADLMVVDAALMKTTEATGPFSYGDQVTFDITVFNQGNIDLYNVVVNDFIPCGYEWLDANNPLWSYDAVLSVATTSIAGPIVAGDSITVSKTLTIKRCDELDAWTNVAELESFEDEAGEDITDEDVDSDADTDPTNDDTTDDVNDNTDGDEDDNDPEMIEIFDLALRKIVVSEGPFSYGDVIEYSICVFNQGNVDASNIVIADHLPLGFSFDQSLNAGWDATDAPNYTYEITSVVAQQDSICIPFFATLESSDGGADSYTNIGEVVSAKDSEGNPKDDADSDPDTDPGNDGDPNDDSIDDPDEEDDHDPAVVNVIDLALVKTTSATGPFKYGDLVTFDIEVFNQGNVDTYDVTVNDFIPCGFKWLASNEPTWSAVGSVAATQITGPIIAGESKIVSITLEVQACASDADGSLQGAWENISEIGGFKNEGGEDIADNDIDSDADSDPNNDDTEDNVNDNTDGDEDDNDPEEIEIFDLAQIKKIVTPGPYMYGDTIEYSICVVNQGNVTATEIKIMDYLPEGLGFEAGLNTDWVETSTDIIEYTIDGPLLRADTICVPIFLTIDMTMGGDTDHTNVSEISSAKDDEGEPTVDADSTADDDPDNDGDSDNDSYHDEEDDHDPADLMVVDVALVKTTAATGPFGYGDQITFDIEVFNQGNIDLFNVVVNDFIPCGYEWVAANSPTWSYDVAKGIATTTILGPVPAGESISVSKTLTIQRCDEIDAWTNTAEVESMQDEDGEDITEEDVDSDADKDPDNDDTTDDVNDNTDGDEDDNDLETIDIFDLALRKTVVSEGPFSFGDAIEYSICVFNQGNVDASNIVLADHLPVGFSFDQALNAGWDATNAPTYSYTITSTLAQQDSICIPFFATLEATDGGADSYTNISEIQAATDSDSNPVEDVDSNPDSDPGNDGDPNNDAINDPNDEDDHDPAVVEVFDLALVKKINNQNPSVGFIEGDLIMYDMIVFNQGNVDAYNIQVCDYIPAGYNYDAALNPVWSGSAPAPTTVCTIIEGPIAAGNSATVMIQMGIMNLGSVGTLDDYRNTAEIGGAEDENGEPQEDIDSTPDGDPENDGDATDDEKDNDNGDEDDSDPALPLFMDLAMKKTLAQDYGPVSVGDVITYNFTVYNQGTIDAYNIEITDHAPPGLTLDVADGNDWDATNAPAYTNVIAGPILVGDSVVLQIDMIVGAFVKTGDYKNVAEISNYEDENGDMPDDYDSDADDDPNNDGDMENDATEGENGDEDDSDYEDLTTFDLALIKEVNTPGPYQTRDIIEFVISIVNQGNMPATDIQVADHVPVGFSFDPLINPNWDTLSAPTYFTTINGPLMPFDTMRVSIFLEIEYLEDATDLDYVNIAEISEAKDIDGNPVDDTDSDPDADPDNDGVPVDNSFEDKDDEDDHDPAGIPSTGLLPPCIPSCDVACVGQLNLSLGEACQTQVSPSMLLAGLDDFCDDPGYADYFNIELKDDAGNLIPGGLITADLVGQLITYSITVIDNEDVDEDGDGTCTNTCWGNILVESKYAPELNCGADIDTISCIELAVFAGPAILQDGTTGCFDADINIEILNEQLLSVDPCAGDLVGKVIRQYQAVDVSGGRSNICTQELHITKLDATLIKKPSNASISLSCTDEFGVIEEDDIRIGVVPFYCPPPVDGVAVAPIPLYPVADNFCNILIEFTDEVILDQDCEQQILRTWEIRQWHCEDEDVFIVPQIVSLVDDNAPVLVCPDTAIEVSTSGSACSAKVILPEISATDSCQMEVTQIDMSFPGGFFENQNGGEVSGIPVGLNDVTYIAYDACGNSSSCQVSVNVIDDSAPVIICEQYVQVSLTNSGEAHVPATVFDDGSYDACGDIVIEARRMELSCQADPEDSTSLIFGEVVTFCCEDAGTVQMVAVRVTDKSGRDNQCMVEVTVVDKNPPSLVAPPDITVSCEFVFDENDLSIFGSVATSQIGRQPIVIDADSVNINGSAFDGLVIGACGVTIEDDVDMGDVSSCGTGVITRVFTVISNGVSVTDEQAITVVSPVAFDPDRIIWPKDTRIDNACDIISLHPDNLPSGFDKPTVEEGVCELLGISITDEQIFESALGQDACFKLFRTWSVVDWCNTNAVTGLPARSDSTQVIEIENKIAPVIDCSNLVVENSFDANCNPVAASLMATATDDCTSLAELSWTWNIDLDIDGSIDTSGTGNEVMASYLPGMHQIIWYAEDLCGNLSNPCTQDFEITNEKAAPAICIDQVVTDLILMDTDFDGIVDAEMVEIWAVDVAKKDPHPCGHATAISFDQAGLQDSIIFNCDDRGVNRVSIWVTDLVNGAQSSCWAEIVVQDNNDLDICGGAVQDPNTSNADVSGLITMESGSQVVEAEVKMLGSELPNALTDVSGLYAFDNMPMGGNYTVVPEKNTNYVNGVSTLDLVMIQKHVLGIDILDSPFKILAADVNKSNSVSAADIVELRKLILGEIDVYSNNTSWRFVDEDHAFTDVFNPWTSLIPEVADIANLSSDMTIDFVGVKVGDVSGNAKGDALITAEVRNSKDPLTFKGAVTAEENNQVVSFSSVDFKEVSGYQMTIEFDASRYEFVSIEGGVLELVNENVGFRYADRGLLTMSWHTDNPLSATSNEVLFKAYFKPKTKGLRDISLKSSSQITVQEAYFDKQITDQVAIEMIDNLSSTVLSIGQNEPNPWRESTQIGFTIPDNGEVSLRLFDSTGKLVRAIVESYGVGYNEITVGRDIILTPGIYLYEIQFKDQIEHKRMIVLD